MSKAFDKAWNERLIFKLKQNGTSGELLHILSDFLSIVNKGLCLMVKIRLRSVCMLKFHKDLF